MLNLAHFLKEIITLNYVRQTNYKLTQLNSVG